MSTRTLEEYGDAAELALTESAIRIQETLRPKGAAVFFYYHSFALQRLRDVRLIISRLQNGSQRLGELTRQIDSFKLINYPANTPFPKEVQEVLCVRDAVTREVAFDFQSLYVFGNMFLDQWSHFAGCLSGLDRSSELDFCKLVQSLEEGDIEGALEVVWIRYQSPMLWLMHQLRFYRNRFVVHVDRPWQMGNSHHYGQDFRFFTPAPVGWHDDDAVAQRINNLLPLAPQWLQEMDENYWERARPLALLGNVFDNIGNIPSAQDRRRVQDIVDEAGITSPSHERLALRLLSFVAEATPVLIAGALEKPDGIWLGSFEETAATKGPLRRVRTTRAKPIK